MNLSDLDTTENVKYVVYGDSGVGKTCFALQFPGPLWMADFDGKIASGANYLKETNPGKLKEVDYDRYLPDTSQGGVRIFEKFIGKLGELEESAKAGRFKYKTIVIDSLTTFSEMLMLDVLTKNPGIKRVALNVPAMQDYLILSTNFKQLVHRIKALPCNVVLLAHIKREKNELTGELVSRPMLTGQLPEQLPILFDEVYRAYTEVKDGKVWHLAQTKNHGGFTARTQVKQMPGVIRLEYAELEKYLKMSVNKKPEKTIEGEKVC